MATQVQWRRGTTAEHSTFAGAEGEITVDTTKDTLVVHDGVTQGGKPLSTEDTTIHAPNTGLPNEAGTAYALNIEQLLAKGLFKKTDPSIPAFTKTGNFTVSTSQVFYAEVGGLILTIGSGVAVSMPTATVGKDYAIWLKTDGTLQATDNFVTPPATNARKIGGFHYAPGGNAPLDPNGNWANHNGGNTTPQINEYSFYDLNWKPSVIDPRGLTLVNNAFWVGIYHLSQNHLSGAVHRNNTNIAKGGQNPQNPYGNGSQYYSDSNWWNISEALAYHGFRMPTMSEFQLYAIGVKEQASRGNDPVTSGLSTTNSGSQNPDERFTSHWGVIQATGVVNQWSLDARVDDADQTTSGLQGRGGRNRYGRAASLGRVWDGAAESGSRAASSATPWLSGSVFGGRGLCDHVILV